MTWINFEEIEPAAIRLPEERKLQNYLLDTAAVAGKVGVESSVNKNNVAMLRQQLIAEKLRLDCLRAQVIFDESQRLKKRLGITAELDATYY